MVKIAVKLRKVVLTFALFCSSVGLVFAATFDIRDDAPTSYKVQTGDTLWDISNLFLNEPWLWPELWRTNTHIENPHLIYPGDILKLRYINGEPHLEVIREKNLLVLTPGARVTIKPNPISVLPWSLFAPYVANDSLIERNTYNLLPTLLGDRIGSPRFANTDYVLAHKLPNPSDKYNVVRKQREVFDSKGKSLGVQITHLSGATVSNALTEQRQVVALSDATKEAKQGDKLLPVSKLISNDLTLAPAVAQVGEVVENMNGNALIGQYDVVIINLGESQVTPGTVFGIYQQGKDLLYNNDEVQADTKAQILNWFSTKKRVEQPAYKVGELVVLRSFENASYAWVTKTDTHLKGGEYIAKP